MSIIKITTRWVPMLLAVLAVGCVVAACGGSSSSTKISSSTGSSTPSDPSSSSSSSRSALIACLKSHGVTLPSRPPGGYGPPPGGYSTGTPGNGHGFFGGGTPNSKLQAAFKACGANFGGGAHFGTSVSHQQIQSYVTCVRQHGYNLPNPNFSGNGPVFPTSIRSNAKFQAASRACQSLLRPAQAPPAQNSAPVTSSA